MTRRDLLLACAAAALPGTSPSWAQDFSRSAISLVVPFPPGGASDVLARAIAPALGQTVSRTTVVENLSGASGSIAAAKFLAAPADGSQILVGSPTETILAPLTIKALHYKASDFRLLGVLYTAPLALYARPDLDAGAIDDLVALAKRPGAKPLNYGSPGAGSLYHITTENLRKIAGLEATHVPYRGGAPMLQDLMAGTIDFTMLPLDNVLGGMVDSRRLKLLAVAAPRRADRYPQVPMLDESLSAKGLGYPAVWVGLFVPRDTPPQLAERLHRAVADTLARADARQALSAAGGTIPATMDLKQAGTFYERDAATLQSMARVANVQPD